MCSVRVDVRERRRLRNRLNFFVEVPTSRGTALREDAAERVADRAKPRVYG
jgi:hypothetical protein